MFSDVFVLSGSGVGGGSLVYANTLYIPPDRFFESSAWSHLNDWKTALMPHYRMAQFMLGVTQNQYEGEADHLLHDIASELGKGDSYVRTPVGVYFGKPNEKTSDPYFNGAGPDRTGCNYCGGCMVGCRVGAKNTLRQTISILRKSSVPKSSQSEPSRMFVPCLTVVTKSPTNTVERFRAGTFNVRALAKSCSLRGCWAP